MSTYSHITRTGPAFSFCNSATSPITPSREAAGGGPVVVQPLMWYRTASIGGLASCNVSARVTEGCSTVYIIPIISLRSIETCMINITIMLNGNYRHCILYIPLYIYMASILHNICSSIYIYYYLLPSTYIHWDPYF